MNEVYIIPRMYWQVAAIGAGCAIVNIYVNRWLNRWLFGSDKVITLPLFHTLLHLELSGLVVRCCP